MKVTDGVHRFCSAWREQMSELIQQPPSPIGYGVPGKQTENGDERDFLS